MREFRADESFAAALCLGNSLGYFGPEGSAAFFAALAVNVRTGGRLILDSYTCAESVFPLPKSRKIAFEGGTYRSRLAYDATASVLKTEAHLALDGETHTLRYAHHIVTSGALVASLREAGFAVVGIHADTDGTGFTVGDRRLLLVAEKS